MEVNYVVKVPFASKKILYNNKSEYPVKGVAYYIFDNDNNCIRQVAKIESMSYRMNDPKMKKPTDFYRRNGSERSKLFKHSKNNNEIINATKLEVENFNNYLIKNCTTIKNAFGFIKGSNVSGDETNFSVDPLLIKFPNNHELSYLRFTNAFNKMKKNKKIKTNWKELEKKSICISEFLKKSDLFKYYFYYYNFDVVNLKELFENNEREKMEKDFEIFMDRDKSHIISNINDSIQILIKKFFDKTILIDDLINRLRPKFRNKLKYYSMNKKIDKDFLNEGISIDHCHAAHLVDVKDLKKDISYNSLIQIADENNGIFVSPTIHGFMDGSLSFDLNGKPIFRGNIPENINSINKKTLTKERLKYLEIRNKKYKYEF